MAAQPSIARNSAIDSAAQAGAIVFSLLTGIVLANVLGAQGRGEYVFATSFAGMLLLGMTNFGLELASSVLVAKDRRRLPQIHTLIALACVLIAAGLGVVVWLAFDTIRGHLLPGIGRVELIALAVALPFWSYQYGCYGILIGLGAVRTRALLELGVNFVQNSAVIVILIAGAGWEFNETLRALVLSFYFFIVLASLILPFVLLRQGALLWGVPGWDLVKEFYRYGFWVYFGNMGSNFSQRVDQYFVQQVSRDSAAFGVYTLAASLTERMRIFPQALTRSAYPQICALPQPDAARLVAACFRQMMALGLFLCGLGLLFAPLIPLIYSREFAGAVVPFLIFLVGRQFSNCSWMLANYFTGHLARPRIPAIVNWAILPVQGVLAYFAMKLGGLIAVAAITSGTYFIVFAVFLALFLRWQNTVRARDLFVLTAEDLRPWRNLFGRGRGKGEG